MSGPRCGRDALSAPPQHATGRDKRARYHGQFRSPQRPSRSRLAIIRLVAPSPSIRSSCLSASGYGPEDSGRPGPKLVLSRRVSWCEGEMRDELAAKSRLTKSACARTRQHSPRKDQGPFYFRKQNSISIERLLDCPASSALRSNRIAQNEQHLLSSRPGEMTICQA